MRPNTIKRLAAFLSGVRNRRRLALAEATTLKKPPKPPPRPPQSYAAQDYFAEDYTP